MSELTEFLCGRTDAEVYERIKTGYSVERPVSLRVNDLKADREEVVAALTAAGGEVQPVSWYASAFVVRGLTAQALSALSLFKEGKIYLQSLSSMLPPLYADPQPGESILDMTAAPGGKTTELYALSGGRAQITACERDKVRFERLRFNLSKQGAGRVLALCEDALALDEFFSFDKILLDAPCTGSGTETPSSPVHITEGFVKTCVNRQEKLLRKAFRLLKKGGTLVYSTCSVLPEENGLQALRFARETGAELLPCVPFEGVPLLPSPEGTLAVCPDALYEGFFVAKFKK